VLKIIRSKKASQMAMDTESKTNGEI